MGEEDFRFLVHALVGGEPNADGFAEVWRWLTDAPHDTLFARSPTDHYLLELCSHRDQSWDFGRRVSNGVVEYYAILRIEKGDWAGITISANHLENWMSPERIEFSASVGERTVPGALLREERLNRLCRLCGLTDFKPAENGADLVARSRNLSTGEFSLFRDEMVR